MDEEVNLELLPMEEDIKDEWSAYQITKPNEKPTVKRVDDGTKVQKRTNKVKPGKQPKVPDEKLTEKARDHYFVCIRHIQSAIWYGILISIFIEYEMITDKATSS